MLITTALAAPLTGATQLVASATEACALDEAGDLWCWGEGLGPGASRRASSVSAIASPSCWLHREGRLVCDAVQSQPFPPGMVQLVQWADRACALGEDGLVRCVGGWTGPFGGPRGVDPQLPTVVAGLEGAVELTASGCVREGDGAVVCATPRGPRLLEGVQATALIDSPAHSYLIDTERAVRLLPSLDKVVSDASSFGNGAGHWPRQCKVDAGQTWCWSLQGRPSAVSFASEGPMALGRDFGCAIGTDRTVACWGEATVQWWGERVAVPWPVVEEEPEDSSMSFLSSERDEPMRCSLVDRQVRCEPPSPFGSLTAPLLALEDIDTLVVARGQSCATRGTTLLCFGRYWLGHSDAGPGVVQFTEVADFTMREERLAIVGADGRLRQFLEGEEMPVLELDAVQVVFGSRVACARRRDAQPLCWSLQHPGELHPIGLPPEARVEELVLREGSVCVAGTRWCARNAVPLQDLAVVVEVTP
jgi:hypothetical protein